MPDYAGLTDREILVLIATQTEALNHVVHGNGQPGLVTRVAKNEVMIGDLRHETVTKLTEIKSGQPGTKERWGMIGTVALAALSIIAKVVGVPVPI